MANLSRVHRGRFPSRFLPGDLPASLSGLLAFLNSTGSSATLPTLKVTAPEAAPVSATRLVITQSGYWTFLLNNVLLLLRIDAALRRLRGYRNPRFARRQWRS